MDPNAALAEIRELTQRHDRDGHLSGPSVDRLCELIDGLDDWLSRAGFPPSAWRADD